MRLVDLIGLYLAVGCAFAVVVFRQFDSSHRARWSSSLLAVPLWPLWVPVVLATEKTPSASSGADVDDLERSLREGAAAVRGTPMESLLPSSAVERLLREVMAASRRSAELTRLLEQEHFDEASATAKILQLERGENHRALASARLHLANVQRLGQLRDRDRRAIEELRELVRALRTQLVLARFSGSGMEGTGELVSEMWARVETLGEVLETGEEVRIRTTQIEESELLSDHATSTGGG